MNNTVHLNALTESYLKSLIASLCNVEEASLDSDMPFTEMGIDSFYVLKLVKQLEQDFGALPKTLLFEYFNIQDLAGFFVEQHSEKLGDILGQSAPAELSQQATANPVQTQTQTQQPAEALTQDADGAVLALEQEALADAQLGETLTTLFEQYKNEGSVSRGTRNIAPNVFIGSSKQGFFNYGRTQDVLLAYAYTGPQDYFNELAAELFEHCKNQGLELNILTDAVLEPIAGQNFTSTPFGVVQRVLDIDKFTTGGSSMRRLRYQVSKFEKAGKAQTREYQCGSDKATDLAIAGIIDQWCGERTMVNPLIHIVKNEILEGRLNEQHRLFLTYLNDELQNVILISKMVSAATGDNGYLMDLEFYPKSMPLGGLEFAIVKMIEVLSEEGCNMLSLGGTYGCKLEDVSSDHADSALDSVLNELREQNVFNDAGNLQFKNKFRPQNKTIYLCRAEGYSNPHNVIDIIMMIADPERQQVSDEANHNLNSPQVAAPVAAIPSPVVQTQSQPAQTQTSSTKPDLPRATLLAEHGFNPLNVSDSEIEFDGKTDSWAQLKLPVIERRMQQLHSQMNQAGNVETQLKTIFGFEHYVLTQSGRKAENIFYQGWQNKGKVLSNLMFPTAIYHQIDKGFEPVELPCQQVFDTQNKSVFKGNLDLDAVKASADSAAMVCVELINNAAAGAPVSLNHLVELKAILTDKQVPLVLDVTRVIENALFVKAHEAEYKDLTVWEIVKQTCQLADALTCSLAKDFCIPFGGFVATNDEMLAQQLQSLNNQAASSLDVLDKKRLCSGLGNQNYIERQVQKRKNAVAALHQQLTDAGLPLVQAAGGHGIVFDPKAISPFSGFANPAASFVAWLYLNTGIRAGIHSVGMQKDTQLNQTVRLAIPVGVKPEQVDALVSVIVDAYNKLENIPELGLHSEKTNSLGDIHAEYQLLSYHNATTVAQSPAVQVEPAQVTVAQVAKPVAAKPQSTASQNAAKAQPKRTGAMDIAIVGMAGRYPKAKDRFDFWQNLVEGRDCVDDISEERLALRRENHFTRSYRGGFLAEVDRFDSLFFNISPREAEILDPQERLFLEVAYEAIEDAGYYPETLAGSDERRDIGVFVGAVWAMYQMVGTEAKLYGDDLNPNSFLWSVANRVSYWMNLSGPSLTVDTACSSSLTALYMACEAVANGQCSGALVGGVNLDLHQQKFDINWSGGALSPDGLCRTFGDGANGYVAGEGVGALYIKPLERALQDKDSVQGVIKSVVVNHGGRTSGYTVPNPKSQAALVTKALEKAQVDAKTIGYIEAHGTGTELGDPIEIRGLSSAFEPFGVENQSCAIGSVKTNIGHLEAAAGVVGVAKVLLQMKHRQLVPSLHSNELNEHIDFAASPFEVVQQRNQWQRKVVDGVTYPLRAGVSSFGAGGANAHVVIEQYEPHAQIQTGRAQSQQLLCFPLSARNEKQLKAFAQKLKAFVENDTLEDIENIAFTLQVGKKSFDERLAIVAASKQDLADKLDCFISGQSDEFVLVGNTKNAQSITRMLSESEKAQFINMLSAQADPLKLAKLWIDGLLSDFQGMLDQANTDLRKVPLPTYPFADKRHWSKGQSDSALQQGTQASLHPLIDCNESTFERQLFKKTFRAADFVIGEHVVSNIATMPGVAYLELARKAGELAAGRPVGKISNVLWLSPLTVEAGGSNEVYIDLQPAGDGVQFDVYSELEGNKRIYAQGRLHYGSSAQSNELLDIETIKSRLEQVTNGEQAYPKFKTLGLEYGPSFQAIEAVYRGEGEVLGQLQLPKVRQGDFADYVLHPALIDAAMQAGVAAQLNDASGKMMVPYSLGTVELHGELTEACYSYITKAENDGKVSRENIVITDDQGKVVLKIFESVGVPLTQVHEKPETQGGTAVTANEHYEELYYHHQWVAQNVPASGSVGPMVVFDTSEQLRSEYQQLLKAAGKPSGQAIWVRPGESFKAIDDATFEINLQRGEDFAQLFEVLKAQGYSLNKVLYRLGNSGEAGDENQLAQALESGVYGMLYLCQALLEHKLLNQTQLLYSYDSNKGTTQAHNDAINGFVKTLRLENSKADCKVVEVQGALGDFWAATLADFDSADTTICYQDGKRFVRQLARYDVQAQLQHNAFVFKHKGVYLITGGAGGLGLIFAKYLAAQCQARLVLTGRSTLDETRLEAIKGLEVLGAEVSYIATDVTDKTLLTELLADVREKFGTIDGIVHGAGVLRDSFLRNKTTDEMAAVLAPKVFGTHYLDALTAQDELDFFVTFSSLAAIGGNAGQCDYAYANHFMDSFAKARNELVAKDKRSGTTVSLNWSLWAEGGMQLDEQSEQIFKRTLGIKPLASEVGVNAFAKALQLNEPHLCVVEAVADKLEIAWGMRAAPVVEQVEAVEQTQVVGASGNLQQQVQDKLIDITIDFLKLERDDIDIDTILMDLGFDSIGLAAFANAVNDVYQTELTPVLFFEYPNIREVAKHIKTSHGAQAQSVHQGGQTAVAATKPVTVATAAEPVSKPSAINKGLKAQSEVVVSGGTDGLDMARRFVQRPIAIVGMSGVMPQSDDLDAFWDNLAAGKNLVTEIPKDRWHWEDVDGDPIKEKNKSYSRWGGFMSEVDKFDPLFFRITPKEAEMMDPQQRILVEQVYQAIENSGTAVGDLAGTRTGLFVGVSAKDYVDVMADHQMALDGYSASGTSHSILANRISFLFDLRGPSAPIDTACSSSLIALHRAIESIHTGSSDMAIIGGVQVMLTPAAHIALSSAGMLSVDGKCKTFDKSANGYVRGEGCGAIFIKTLEHAQRDGNPIHAVVKATAENHGGKVSALTVPNPNAQYELLVEAYEKSEVDPACIGYIECHGTGTSLGDPIEIQALTRAFKQLYDNKQSTPPANPHCGLSAVKTNIGHLEPVAGMAGLLKALLSIKHKQIPGLVHFDEVNPYIELDNSGLYIVDKTTDWVAPTGTFGEPMPRVAGVSSFGWGGANAHVVVAEHIEQTPAVIDFAGPQMIVLSARNQDRLKAYAESLLNHLNQNSHVNLNELAYTLQVGRDAMEHRLALTGDSVAAVKDKLAAFIAGNDGQIYQGVLDKSQEELSALTADSNDSDSVLSNWCRGRKVDWAAMYENGTPKRICLPTYPFERQRYWIDPSEGGVATGGQTAVIHPLVHRNSSVLGKTCFDSNFTGREFFLAEHRVHGDKVLPSMAVAEMARVAAEQALDGEAQQLVEIGNIHFGGVVQVPEQTKWTTEVTARGTSAVNFDIQCHQDDVLQQVASGYVTFESSTQANVMDINHLKALMTEGEVAAESLYQRFEAGAMVYGDAFKVVKHQYLGHQQQLLELSLPESLGSNVGEYQLHPAMLDGVLQGVATLLVEDEQLQAIDAFPKGLDKLLMLSPCTTQMYAWVRYARGCKPVDPEHVLDVDLLDSDGNVCIKLSGLRLANRAFEQQKLAERKTQTHQFERLLEKALSEDSQANESTEAEHNNNEFEKILAKIF